MRGGRRVQIRTRCLILGKNTFFSRLNHSTLTVTRAIVKPQLDILGSTECSFTNKKLQYAAVSQSTLGGSFGRPRLSNCLAQSASVEREREARAVSDGSRREGGRGAGGRRLDDGARPASVHSRQKSIVERARSTYRCKRSPTRRRHRTPGSPSDSPRRLCEWTGGIARQIGVCVGEDGRAGGGGRDDGRVFRVVAGHARKRSSPAAPPARLP